MVRRSLEHAGLARPAGPFGAGGEHCDTGVFDDGQDRAVRWDLQRLSAALEDHLETLRPGWVADRLRCEAFDLQGAGRPVGALRLDRGQQWLGPAVVDQGVGPWLG